MSDAAATTMTVAVEALDRQSPIHVDVRSARLKRLEIRAQLMLHRRIMFTLINPKAQSSNAKAGDLAKLPLCSVLNGSNKTSL